MLFKLLNIFIIIKFHFFYRIRDQMKYGSVKDDSVKDADSVKDNSVKNDSMKDDSVQVVWPSFKELNEVIDDNKVSTYWPINA